MKAMFLKVFVKGIGSFDAANCAPTIILNANPERDRECLPTPCRGKAQYPL